MADAALFPIEAARKAREPASSELLDSCSKLFDDLDAAKMLGPVERAKRTVLLATARSLDAALAEPTITVATSNTLKQYLEALDKLPRPTTSDDPLDALDLALMAATGTALAERYPVNE